MTTKEEIELIEKSIGHLSKAVVGISSILSTPHDRRSLAEENVKTKEKLLEEIHLLTTTIAQMQAPKIEVK